MDCIVEPLFVVIDKCLITFRLIRYVRRWLGNKMALTYCSCLLFVADVLIHSAYTCHGSRPCFEKTVRREPIIM